MRQNVEAFLSCLHRPRKSAKKKKKNKKKKTTARARSE